MFLSEEVTSLPKDKCFIDFKSTWHEGHCFSSKIEKKSHTNLTDLNAQTAKLE